MRSVALGMPLLGTKRSRAELQELRAREVLVVVGHGMVAHHLCQQLVSRGGHARFRIVVFGEERQRAYDRVHLSCVIRGQDPLYLCDDDFYSKHGIELRTGVRIDACDLERQVVRAGADEVRFDKLVFATGSRPVVPSVPGADLPVVTCLRSVGDAVSVRERALASARAGLPAVVVGAGLLGLEAAHELATIGCSVVLVESAEHLLPRQLDDEVAERLLRVVEGAGFQVRLGARVVRIEPRAEHASLELSSGEVISAGFVLFAAGVRPRDELARESGIHCDLFGGIQVDDTLASSKPGVFAVGECARHRGFSYGLVAPGRQMAEVLAARLMGEKDLFRGAELATRLKVPEVELTVVGESNVRDLSTAHVVRDHEGSFQKLVLRRRRLVGIAAIGPWKELQAAQGAVAMKVELKASRLDAFKQGRDLFPAFRNDIRAWPEAATVCVCTGVTAGTLVRAQRDGHCEVESLCRATGAGTVCGTCRPLVASVFGAVRPERAVTGAETIALLAGVGVLCALLLPAIPHVPSVQVPIRWDVTWSDELGKQVSGFSLVGLSVLGLALALRKRLSWFSRFRHASLRTFHVATGALAVLAYVVHTGLRLGVNLDRALALAFLGSAFVGALAALLPALVRRRPALARFKVWLERAHLYAVWPLPVLVVFHVLKVYFF